MKANILVKNPRIIICGWPSSGKTNHAIELGSMLGIEVKHTDTLHRTLAWSNVSEEVSHWLDDKGPWIIEGVAIPRALRKWRRRHPRTKRVPFDRIIVMQQPDPVGLKPGQVTMGKGHDTVLRELESWIGGYL
jgi:hypothetical protein